jgi:hypothetical protein
VIGDLFGARDKRSQSQKEGKVLHAPFTLAG